MCRKKISARDQLALFEEQGIRPFEPFEERGPIYNLTAGYSSSTIVYQDEKGYHFKLAHWGLIPGWAKSKDEAKKISNGMVNARSETVYEKPSYKNLLTANRCIISAGGFYEHHHTIRNKKDFAIPFYINRHDCKSMGIAGLHNTWVDKSTGEVIPSFTMITTAANELMSRIHNHGENKHRMPLILEAEMFKEWLDPGTARGRVDEILSYRIASSKLDAWPVNKIGPKTIDAPEMIERVAYPEIDWA